MGCLSVHVDRELASLSLVVPLLNPVDGAQRGEGLEKDLARLEVLTLNVDTLVVVNVRLSTVLGLVLVRETGVELGGFELEVVTVNFNHCGDKCGG